MRVVCPSPRKILYEVVIVEEEKTDKIYVWFLTDPPDNTDNTAAGVCSSGISGNAQTAICVISANARGSVSQ